MDLREGIQSQFRDLGFEVSESILDKCVEICVLHNIDEETFVETWTAYSVTNLGGDAPTLETLMQMERKELVKQDRGSVGNRQSTTPLTVYNKTPTTKKSLGGDRWSQTDTTPKGTRNDSLLSRQLTTSSSRSTFSPASYSPVSTTVSEKYATRTNAGEVVCEFVERAAGDWKGKEGVRLTIAPYHDEVLTSTCRSMMEPLSSKAVVLSDVIDRVGEYLVEVNKLSDPVDMCRLTPADVVCIGRICCDSDDHLNRTSVLLEGSWGLSYGKALPLDLSKLSHFTLFPGQVVAVVGFNPTGNKFIVNKLYHSAPLPLPPRLPRFSGPVEIVIAAGPFTQSDSLAYEPLEDLMSYVHSHKPHVLILIGPLVDLRQPLTQGSIAETYENLFDKIVKGVVDKVKGSWTQVVVVSSSNDAVCLPVYPTPPPRSQCASPFLHFVSDPSLLNINGLVIALTSTDSLMHLGKEEMSLPAGGSDRLGRLASHLLQQQSLYPLYPPSEEVPIDYELWDNYATLPVTPHVLVVPSRFRYFIKHLQGCLVVNPEALTKGVAGGTFTRLEVEPPTDDTWTPATHISAQVLKI